ncbi:HDOD domain-containing protein [Thiolapillus sp.]|uniref:HDOD domain-containing protein n=1 Tax=Thiolapillus sp. TaxID=2017437 RepID=UPI003AF6959E
MTPQSLAKEVDSIYSLPEVAIRINELLAAPNTTVHDIERVIALDPALTAKILKLINSSFYGFSRKIETVAQAVSLLGHKEIRNLVLATSVTATFTDVPPELVDMESFWYNSVTCAAIAKILAEHFQMEDHERFFTAGLLHSLGKLIFYTQCPRQSARILQQTNRLEDAITAAETEEFGFNYAEVGAELLVLWKLPAGICQMVRHHVHPAELPAAAEDAVILHAANRIAAVMEPGVKMAPDTEIPPPQFDPGVEHGLNLLEDLILQTQLEASLYAFEFIEIIKPGVSLIL